jgi:hypothetical protein
MRKILLISLVVAGLLLTTFLVTIQFSKPTIAFAKQWTVGDVQGVAIGDYNNDGLNEIAFSEYDMNRVTVYKSDGTTVIKQWTGLSHPVGVAIGDYDNDGLNELAFAEQTGGRVTVYKSDGTTVAKQWTGLSSPMGVAIGDYDNDGLNELAFAEYVGRVTVYKSDGTTVAKQWTGLGFPEGVAIGDYDNDGLNELAFAELGGGGGGRVTVYKSDGTTVAKQWTGLNSPEGVAIGDYDNDGLNELAFAELGGGGGGRVTVYKSDGITVLKRWITNIYADSVAIGDYNNDGLNDIAFNSYATLTVYYQTKPGTAARVAEPTIVTLRGTLTNTSGYPIQTGSIRVTVMDSLGTQVWQDTFDNVINNGKYNIPLGTKTTLKLVKGQIYNAILEVDADSTTFGSADVIYGDNNPAGDLIRFVA